MGFALHKVLVSTTPIVRDEIPTDSPLTGCYPIAVPIYFCSYWYDFVGQSRLSVQLKLIRFQDCDDIISKCVGFFVISSTGFDEPLGILFFMMSINMVRVGLSRRGLGSIVRTPLLTIFFRDGTVFYAMYVLRLIILVL